MIHPDLRGDAKRHDGGGDAWYARRMRWEFGTAAAIAIALACSPSAFTCLEDAECSGGVCQSTGSCSFPDDACDSGQRYGEHAASGLAGECVELGATGSTTATEPGSGPVPSVPSVGLDSSSGDPSITATETATTQATEESSSTTEAIDPDLLIRFRFEDLPGNATFDSVAEFAATCQDPECPIITAGPFGQAALFDGNNDALSIEYDPLFELPPDFTAAVWVRADTLDGDIRRMVFGHPFDTELLNSWLLYFRNAGNGWEASFSMSSSNDTYLATPIPFSLGEWAHLAGTYDGVTMRFYVDGALVDSRITPPPVFDPQHPITIGYDINDGQPARHFEGAIDEARLYTRALDPEEIAALASR